MHVADRPVVSNVAAPALRVPCFCVAVDLLTTRCQDVRVAAGVTLRQQQHWGDELNQNCAGPRCCTNQRTSAPAHPGALVSVENSRPGDGLGKRLVKHGCEQFTGELQTRHQLRQSMFQRPLGTDLASEPHLRSRFRELPARVRQGCGARACCSSAPVSTITKNSAASRVQFSIAQVGRRVDDACLEAGPVQSYFVSAMHNSRFRRHHALRDLKAGDKMANYFAGPASKRSSAVANCSTASGSGTGSRR